MFLVCWTFSSYPLKPLRSSLHPWRMTLWTGSLVWTNGRVLTWNSFHWLGQWKTIQKVGEERRMRSQYVFSQLPHWLCVGCIHPLKAATPLRSPCPYQCLFLVPVMALSLVCPCLPLVIAGFGILYHSLLVPSISCAISCWCPKWFPSTATPS